MKRLDPAHPVRAYLSALSGRERLGIIYGDFATANEAGEALNQLPADLRALGPYVRTVSKLR
jgi:septal ring-binding cell division protein DamX